MRPKPLLFVFLLTASLLLVAVGGLSEQKAGSPRRRGNEKPCRNRVHKRDFAPQEIVLGLGQEDVAVYGAAESWRLTAEWKGMAVEDLNGDGIQDLVMGAPGACRRIGGSYGEVYVMFGPLWKGTTLDLRSGAPDLIILSPFNDWEQFGQTVSVADLSGDGISDLVISISASLITKDIVFVIFGPFSAGVMDMKTRPADVEILSRAPDDLIGVSLVTGDLNDDGFQDLVLGAPGAKRPLMGHHGEVYVFFGPLRRGENIDLSVTEADATLFCRPEDGILGQPDTIAVGDLTGDEFDDLVVGLPANTGSGKGYYAGRVHVFFGPIGPGFLDLASDPPDVTVEGAASVDHTGRGLAIADVSGDGIGDLAMGALGGNGPGETRRHAGEVAVVFGPLESGRTVELGAGEADVTIFGAHEIERLGQSILSRDITCDGVADLVLGAERADLAYVLVGPLHAGRDFDLATEPVAVTFLGQHGSGLGNEFAVGDLDGDGRPDLALGAWMENARWWGWSRGAAYVVFGESLWPGKRRTDEHGDENGD